MIAPLLAIGGAVILAGGGALSAFRRGPGLAVQAAGMALLGAAGALILTTGETVGAVWRNGPSPALGLDPLSGLFLALLAVTALPTLVYAQAYLRQRAAGPLLAAFLLALAGLLAARDLTTFLACWELMTLLPAAAILVARHDAPVRSAVQAYLAITHLGGAGVWIALVALPTEHHTLVAIAALIGFGTKAGLVPLHSWLPRAHPVAPAPFSALMSGLMVKVALYGLIRVEFEWLGTPPRWLGVTLLVVGLVSALGGVLWALMQHDLKRLLAYSTIENVGVIVAALGAAALIADPVWSALAFAAALLHTINHGVFKALLFLGAGAIERTAGTLDLDRLGGLARRLPWTGAAFAVGCAAIAGVPPLSGFASEWLTLRALAHLAFDGPVALGVAGAAALAGIAATAALALLCFVKVAGLVLLGPSREEAGDAGAEAPAATRAAQRGEAPVPMRVALVTLAGLCVVLGLVPGVLLGTLVELAPGAVTVDTPPGTGSYPAVALALVLVLATAALVRLRGARRAAPAPTWACGQPVTARLNWTSAGFTKPLRLISEPLLRPRRSLEVVRSGGVVQAMRYRREIGSPAQRLLYGPVMGAALRSAAVARRLQTGNVRTYAAYLLGLVLVLLVLMRAGAFG